MQSGLPYNGKVRLTVDSLGKKLTLRVRKPEWCDEKFANERDGFLIYDGVFGGDVIEIDFAPRVRAVHADARVFENGGRRRSRTVRWCFARKVRIMRFRLRRCVRTVAKKL